MTASLLLVAVLTVPYGPEPEQTGDVQTEKRIERLVEIPGYARVRVTADGGSPTVGVRADNDGTVFVDVGGADVTQTVCELVDVVPTGVYMGCGWYVAEPGDFSLSANGHENAVRYAGFDLSGGRSLVMASSLPPLVFRHRKALKTAGFQCEGASRFALFPGRDGAFACALRSRRFFDSLGETAAPGVRAKADKFCVDTWNGSSAITPNSSVARRLMG